MTSTDQGQDTPPTDLDDIEADIVRHREQLSETVEELVDRVNVKARAERKAAETKQRLTAEVDRSMDRLQSGDPAQMAAAAAPVLAAVAVLALAVYWLARRR